MHSYQAFIFHDSTKMDLIKVTSDFHVAKCNVVPILFNLSVNLTQLISLFFLKRFSSLASRTLFWIFPYLMATFLVFFWVPRCIPDLLRWECSRKSVLSSSLLSPLVISSDLMALNTICRQLSNLYLWPNLFSKLQFVHLVAYLISLHLYT